MSSNRPEKIADLLKREVSKILNQEVKDPRLQNINITAVKVTYDIGIAYVFYTIIGKSIKKDESKIDNEIKLLKEKKEQAQPTKIRTSGSTFKNPINQSDKKVWQLIKESVPLEKSFGDASISQKHCNFFVNKSNAKFEDMKKLINFVSESVFKKTGIKLETEIKILE